MNTHGNENRDWTEAGGWLHLAATPTFAAMALVTTVTDAGPARMLCQAMGVGSLSLDGMTLMYLLMAIFHAGPWWKWMALRTRSRARANRGCAPNLAAGESRWR
ncbi:MAG TPA: hypothetical protein VFY97_06020 [Rhodanobacteraceae bacterium]|nr:hypothetical protein [Rhodanobacteraceae bacterium]